MAKLSIVAGATSQSVNVFIQDSSSTTGAGLTGLAFNTASLVAYYTFTGANAAATAITLATLAAVGSAYSSGGFKEIDATNMPGLYRLDLPNAALATSKGRVVTVLLKGATNMAPCALDVELTAWDNQDAVRGALTALPNAAAGANGGLPLSVDTAGRVDVLKVNGTSQTARDLGASVLLSSGTGTGQVSLSSGLVSLSGTQTFNVTGNITGNLSGSVGSVTAATAVTSNVKKNQALAGFTFIMTDSTTHAPKTGVTVTAQRSLDGAALGSCVNTATEISNGLYMINLAAADLNANVVLLRFTGTSSDDRDILIITQP